MDPIKACIDRHLRPNLALDVRLAGWRDKLWPEGQRRLHIRFLGGSINLQRRVMTCALEWENYAGVELVFSDHPRAQIRIAFDPDGSWSYIGTDALDPSIRPSEPTVNFGWLTDRSSDAEVSSVVLHEFGHVLGMIHEHQSPAAGIPWNQAAVYAYYQGPPNFWTREQIDANIFARYEKHSVDASQFDARSIMLYPIPDQLTQGNYRVGWNTSLSDLDKQKIAEIYPPSRIR